MTVDIFGMIEMRDAQVAEEVSRMAELGWFDTEFTMYGCCYFKNGDRQYRLSAEPEKIYEFIEHAAQQGCIVSSLQKISERYPVPVGMKDSVALDVKKALAMYMQDGYPIEFFKYMQQLKEIVKEDSGYLYLKKQQEQLSSCFDRELLRRYELELDFIYESDKLTEEHYEQFKVWLREEHKNMEEDAVHKEIYEKIFYGFGYIEANKVKYVINARKDSVYKRKAELQAQRLYTTPIYSQEYYYSFNVKLPQVKQRFEKELAEYYTAEKVSELQAITGINHKIAKDDYNKRMQQVTEQYGTLASETMKRYGYRWGILL